MAFLTNIHSVSHLIVALLGRQLLYAAIACVLIGVLTKALRLRSPAWHIGLWSLVLLRLLLPPDLASPISVRAIVDRLVPVDRVSDRIEHTLLAFTSPDAVVQTSPLIEQDSAAAPRRAIRPSWQMIALACWLLGMGGGLELFLRKRSRYRALIRDALPVDEGPVAALLQECRAQFKVARPVRVVTSDRAVSPFTSGVAKPVIYIPQRLLEGGGTTALYAMIAHEMNHIKRHDVVWITLQNIVQIAFFFFPVAWYVNRQIELARECICDRAVVTGGKISSAQYGSSLLLVLKFCVTSQERLEFLPAFNAQYRILKQRIQRLKTYERPQTTHPRAMYAALLLVGAVALPMAPDMAGIAFFTPFNDANRQTYESFRQRMVKPYAAAYSTTLGCMQYTGVGLQGEFGEAVYAIGAGDVVRVTGAAPHTEVVVAHTLSRSTTIFSVYARIADVRVRVGDRVTEATQIGRLLTREEYAAGGLAEQHLHLEVRRELDAYRSRSPHYLKYERPDIVQDNFLNPALFYRQHLQG